MTSRDIMKEKNREDEDPNLEELKDLFYGETEKVIQCPFCKETGFDLSGLKSHLVRGWCEIWMQTNF